MTKPRIGLLVIGQTPRPDLTALLGSLADECDVFAQGALDGLSQRDLPDPAGALYPLVTRLRDGTRVLVDEEFVLPLLKRALTGLEAKGVAAALLMCAAPFRELRGRIPILKPYSLAVHTLRSAGRLRPAVVIPTSAQAPAAQRKWTHPDGSVPVWSVEAKPPGSDLDAWLACEIGRCCRFDVLVLDFVGWPRHVAERIRKRTGLRVLDLGHHAVDMLRILLPRPPEARQ